MESKHKENIRKNFCKILQNTNLEILLQHNNIIKIFPNVLLEKYQLISFTPTERKRQFYFDIQTRGPKAYNLLLEACLETRQYELYSILNMEPYNPETSGEIVVNSVDSSARPIYHPSLNADSEKLIKTLEDNAKSAFLNLGTETKKIQVKTSGIFMDDPKVHKYVTPYSMRSSNRGVVFVINNINFIGKPDKFRTGADVDRDNLKKLFEQLKFKWIYWEDQTRKDFENKLREFTNDPILEKVDCCFVIIMSHGTEGHNTEDTRIVTHDNLDFRTADIIHNFSNRNCRFLQNKPKVIIFQSCRGDLQDFGVVANLRKHTRVAEKVIEKVLKSDTVESDSASGDTISYISDILVCYSSYAGFKSYRDMYLGSWFIQHLCETIMDHAHEFHIRQLLDMTSSKVVTERTKDDARQIPYISSVGFRPCFLNPGI